MTTTAAGEIGMGEKHTSGIKLTKADRDFMSRGERRKAANEKKRRQAVDRSERVGPTPETLAKLVPCPIQTMYDLGLIDNGVKGAALELADIYVAVYGSQMPGSRGAGGHHQLSDEMAWKHKFWFLPWERRWARVKFKALPTVIDVVVHGKPMAFTEVAEALADYARIRRETPMPAKDRLAREVA